MHTASETMWIANGPNCCATDCWISGMPESVASCLYTPVSSRMKTVVEQISSVSM